MPRYIALLRGVSPLNAKMVDLKRSFEAAGWANVRTILGTGNVAFDAPASAQAALEQRAELAMQKELGRSFYTIVRPATALQALLATDPFSGQPLAPGAKRVVSFMRAPRQPAVPLPLAQDGAVVLRVAGAEAFTCYVPNAKGPVFMALIQTALGKEVTTRTWDTVRKCAVA